MGIAGFIPGTLVVIEGCEYRLLRKVSETLWQLEETKTLRVRELHDSQLLALYSDGKLIFTSGSGPCGQIHHTVLVEKDLAIAQMRLKYVLAIADLPKTRSVLEPVISDLWNKNKEPERAAPGYVTVIRWRDRYNQSGKDIRALADNSAAKGNREPRYDPEVLDICNDSIRRVYLTRRKGGFKDVVEHAQLRVIEKNKQRVAELQLPLRLPTRRLLTRLIYDIPAIDRHSAREGRDDARHMFRAALHQRSADGPLAIAEIDHTKLDIYVVDDVTGLALDRLYLTACMDFYTRCILGIYVGFIPPSYHSVAKCLRNAILPKTNLREQYPEIKSDWIAFGAMQDLVCDNGLEFHGTGLEQVCQALGINLTFSPRRQPWYKPHIERFFRSVNQGLVHGLPGTTFSNIKERGDRQPPQEARIRLSTFQIMLRKWIVDVYHQEIHRALQTSPDAKWRNSIGPVIPLPMNPGDLDIILAKPETRVLGHKGIEIDRLSYNSAELQELLKKHGASLKVEVRVDQDDIGHIFVLPPAQAKPIIVPAINPEYACGISVWQHDRFRELARSKGAETNVEMYLQAKNELAEMVQKELTDWRRTTRRRAARHMEHTRLANANREPEQPITDEIIGVAAQQVADTDVAGSRLLDQEIETGARLELQFETTVQRRYRGE